MKTLTLIQGTPEWHAHRAQHDNASDAPAMMGVSSYKTRTQLLNEKKTGVTKEVDSHTQRIFDNGHRFEALARCLAEAIIGDELFPVTGTLGRYSASFDGYPLNGVQGFEHKTLNETLRKVLTPGATGLDLPMEYQVQMEQQCMVGSLEQVLFLASKWTDQGELVEERHCWYEANPKLAADIVRGWDQFHRDLDGHEVAAPVVKAVATPIESLPMLVVQLEGRVLASNLEAYRSAADKFLAGVKKDLVSDQDFADAEAFIKTCQTGEDKLASVKEQALAQTSTIDELFRTVDHISAGLRTERLALEKLVKARKESIRTDIIIEGREEIAKHVANITARLGGKWLPEFAADFATAMKNKRTVDSLREAANYVVTTRKMAYSEAGDRIEINRKSLIGEAHDYMFLFPDFAAQCNKGPEDFAATLALRIASDKERKEAEAKRIADLATAEAACTPAVATPATVAVPQAQAAAVIATAMRRAPTPEIRAAVVEHQDEISLFLNTVSADAKTKQTVRAYLVEYVKFVESRKKFAEAAK